jgi:hypothetical protein
LTSVVAIAAAFVTSACDRRREPATTPVASPNNTPGILFHGDTASPVFGAVDVVQLDANVLNVLKESAPTQQEWQSVLAVYTGDDRPGDEMALPVMGRYTIVDGVLRFTPRFPPVPGQPYHARFDGTALGRHVAGLPAKNNVVIVTSLLVPRSVDDASTYVESIFPAGDSVPVNLLRLYIHFSAPMSVGEAQKRVRLLDGAGREVEDAFLVVPNQELWDPEHRRLTLLFDPGRIKQGIRPNEELGMALRVGDTYTLVVDSTWQDAEGNRLSAGQMKRFTVGPADRESPRPEEWLVTTPNPGSRAPIVLDFPEALDHALLQRLLVVKRTQGAVRFDVPGRVEVPLSAARWMFFPESGWQAGTYVVEVDTDLEDLAGNNLRGVFDVDRTVPQPAAATTAKVTVPFVIR